MDAQTVCLQTKESEKTALHFAVEAKKPEIVKLLLKNEDISKKLVGIQDKYGQTALHWAASLDRDDIYKIIYNKMEPSQTLLLNSQGRTASNSAKNEDLPN